MTANLKRKTLIWLGLVMTVMVLIAVSLPQLELQPGMPLPRLENDQVVMPAAKAEPFQVISVNKLILAYILLLAAGSMLYLTYKRLRGIEWKKLKSVSWLILLIGLSAGSLVFLSMLFKSEGSTGELLVMPTPEPPVQSPLGSAPPMLLWLVGISLLVTGILIGVWIFTSRAHQATTIDIVGLEAEKAWQELKSGLGLKDVIIKCYGRMSLALKKAQGIERKDFMTTREFERLLEEAGVPHDPVHQLTQLFEAVRYGNWQPNPPDEQKAIHCLEAILVYSRKARETN